jgi:hypothetical protein
MADATAISDLIDATADGAGRGMAALRAAGIPACLEDFAVEVRFDDDPGAPRLSASVMVTIIVDEPAGARLAATG